MEFSDLEALESRIVHSEDGQEIGSITAVHFGGRMDEPLFVEVATQWHEQNLVVPIVDATVNGRNLVLPYDANDLVRGPSIEPDDTMTTGDARSVVRYYDVELPEAPEEPTGTGYRKRNLPPIVNKRHEDGRDEW